MLTAGGMVCKTEVSGRDSWLHMAESLSLRSGLEESSVREVRILMPPAFTNRFHCLNISQAICQEDILSILPSPLRHKLNSALLAKMPASRLVLSTICHW